MGRFDFGEVWRARYLSHVRNMHAMPCGRVKGGQHHVSFCAHLPAASCPPWRTLPGCRWWTTETSGSCPATRTRNPRRRSRL